MWLPIGFKQLDQLYLCRVEFVIVYVSIFCVCVSICESYRGNMTLKSKMQRQETPKRQSSLVYFLQTFEAFYHPIKFIFHCTFSLLLRNSAVK